MSRITALRKQFQKEVCSGSIFLKEHGIPSIADIGSNLSSDLSRGMIAEIALPLSRAKIDGQTAGTRFEISVKNFVGAAMKLLVHLRPGDWKYTVHGKISDFAQYQHIEDLNRLIANNKAARTALGDYVVKPDVIVAREPIRDSEINKHSKVVSSKGFPYHTPLRKDNTKSPSPLLHASISCKLTLRSDRSQNARTEGLNLIRNRKGHSPHIAVVTAEPMPTRIASLAMGTGDIDCVYHFCLSELENVVKKRKDEALIETLSILVDGKRLRDIADLPFDLIS